MLEEGNEERNINPTKKQGNFALIFFLKRLTNTQLQIRVGVATKLPSHLIIRKPSTISTLTNKKKKVPEGGKR